MIPHGMDDALWWPQGSRVRCFRVLGGYSTVDTALGSIRMVQSVLFPLVHLLPHSFNRHLFARPSSLLVKKIDSWTFTQHARALGAVTRWLLPSRFRLADPGRGPIVQVDRLLWQPLVSFIAPLANHSRLQLHHPCLIYAPLARGLPLRNWLPKDVCALACSAGSAIVIVLKLSLLLIKTIEHPPLPPPFSCRGLFA